MSVVLCEFTMRTVSVSDAKANFAALVAEVEESHEIVRITRRGRPAAVLISSEDFRSLHEALVAVSSSNMLRDLDQAQDDFQAGRTVRGDDLRRRFGLDA